MPIIDATDNKIMHVYPAVMSQKFDRTGLKRNCIAPPEIGLQAMEIFDISKYTPKLPVELGALAPLHLLN